LHIQVVRTLLRVQHVLITRRTNVKRLIRVKSSRQRCLRSYRRGGRKRDCCRSIALFSHEARSRCKSECDCEKLATLRQLLGMREKSLRVGSEPYVLCYQCTKYYTEDITPSLRELLGAPLSNFVAKNLRFGHV